MTQKEFLKNVGLSREEFQDLVSKFNNFRTQLNPAQQGAVQRSMPTLSQASRSFGGELTADGLSKVVRQILGQDDPGDGGTSGYNILRLTPVQNKPKQ